MRAAAKPTRRKPVTNHVIGISIASRMPLSSFFPPPRPPKMLPNVLPSVRH
jgi:hypothetical protein